MIFPTVPPCNKVALIEGKHRKIATVRREPEGIEITFESDVPSLSAAKLTAPALAHVVE